MHAYPQTLAEGSGHRTAAPGAAVPQVSGDGRRLVLPALMALLAASGSAVADVWVLEPSIGVDQRFDDNYLLRAPAEENTSTTRLLGSLGLSRESRTTIIRGLLQADGTGTLSDAEDNAFESNQLVAFDTRYNTQRARIGLDLSYKRDRPTQSIAADITENAFVGVDSGENADNQKDVGRERVVVSPNWQYELSRRSSLDARLTYTDVTHGLTDPDDALRERYANLGELPAPPTGYVPGIPLDEVTFDDVPTPFLVSDELDNFREGRADLAWKFKLSPIGTLSLNAGYIDYRSDTEADPRVRFPFEEQIPDPDQRFVLRNPTRESLSNTVRLTAGYDTQWSPSMTVGFEFGGFRKEIDDSDLLRLDDADSTGLSGEELLAAVAEQKSTETGWLANASLRKLTRRASYDARLAFDLTPSDVGREQQALDLRLGYTRELSHFLRFSLQARAYDPDASNAAKGDKFKRRFLSLEPKFSWELSRAWSMAVSYLYRRQRSLVEFGVIGEDDGDLDTPLPVTEFSEFRTGESNALLFSIRYSPPSPVQDLRGSL